MLSMHIVSLLEMMQWRSVYCGKKRMDKTSVTSPLVVRSRSLQASLNSPHPLTTRRYLNHT